MKMRPPFHNFNPSFLPLEADSRPLTGWTGRQIAQIFKVDILIKLPSLS